MWRIVVVVVVVVSGVWSCGDFGVGLDLDWRRVVVVILRLGVVVALAEDFAIALDCDFNDAFCIGADGL